MSSPKSTRSKRQQRQETSRQPLGRITTYRDSPHAFAIEGHALFERSAASRVLSAKTARGATRPGRASQIDAMNAGRRFATLEPDRTAHHDCEAAVRLDQTTDITRIVLWWLSSAC
jgi:hypothetical protein